ncbi:Cytidylate kinase [Paramagnetospirillum magnetotacticum MS-1]|uniref:Cytidylate kinase n=1 Tax=Paramagnetospirillum magnetotacticum MS-1 TaxID=272627 RepID=A0A0C2YPU6_PARME|nr:cytidylate kinase-like family protein [Paramagnetospirillum magnetotacticum]KIL97118.1 Cytidylate kinase [Paramagnetospirillum magnetotacticum MS-1]
MTTNILSVISAMAEVATVPRQGDQLRPRQPVITLSRDFGSGGDVIATRVCQRLKLPLYDEELLREVAARLNDDPAIVRLMDEGFGRAKDMWLYRLFSGKDISPDAYRDTLVKVVMSLGRLGGIIVGRGAHIILAGECALRVRVAGSPEVCAKRMAEQGHGNEADLLAKAQEINHRRGKFVWEAFHSRLSDASQFDLTINTDRMEDFEDVVETIVVMAEAVHSGRVLRGDLIRAHV